MFRLRRWEAQEPAAGGTAEGAQHERRQSKQVATCCRRHRRFGDAGDPLAGDSPHGLIASLKALRGLYARPIEEYASHEGANRVLDMHNGTTGSCLAAIRRILIPVHACCCEPC
jgi:hypothetical protein